MNPFIIDKCFIYCSLMYCITRYLAPSMLQSLSLEYRGELGMSPVPAMLAGKCRRTDTTVHQCNLVLVVPNG